jgi:methylenetetrahydrofolate dehydrogenase (NADP+) / methenyltetrahydrofolate cyclohydrolase
MPAKIIDGTALANSIRADVARRVKELEYQRRKVRLTALMVGATPAGELYAQRQAEACKSVGIEYTLITLSGQSSNDSVMTIIGALNRDPQVSGIMLHLPVPEHLDAPRLQYAIDPPKDVEGVNPANIGYVVYGRPLVAPCTALAVLELIKSTGVKLEGAHATVVGASEISGKPIALLLTQHNATVTLCHKYTTDLQHHTAHADILISSVGKPALISADHIKPGAVVIDVGINRITLPDGTKKTVGDIDFAPASEKASHLTPVPGGVGPMTVAMLLRNTLHCAELLAKQG